MTVRKTIGAPTVSYHVSLEPVMRSGCDNGGSAELGPHSFLGAVSSSQFYPDHDEHTAASVGALPDFAYLIRSNSSYSYLCGSRSAAFSGPDEQIIGNNLIGFMCQPARFTHETTERLRQRRYVTTPQIHKRPGGPLGRRRKRVSLAAVGRGTARIADGLSVPNTEATGRSLIPTAPGLSV